MSSSHSIRAALMEQKVVRPVRHYIRASFLAGLFVALPIGFTVVVLIWIWNKMAGPLNWILGFTSDAVGESMDGFGKFLSTNEYTELIVPFLGLAILLIVIFILGIITRSILGTYLLGLFESLMTHVPFVGLFYSSVKQLSQAFWGKEGASQFKGAVLVQFPMEGSWVIGFITGMATGPLGDAMSRPLRDEAARKGLPVPEVVTVFVPTTPLPTQGFTLVLPRSETRALSISVDEAIKVVISGGVIKAPEENGRKDAVGNQGKKA